MSTLTPFSESTRLLFFPPQGYEYVKVTKDDCCGRCVQTHCILNFDSAETLVEVSRSVSTGANKVCVFVSVLTCVRVCTYVPSLLSSLDRLGHDLATPASYSPVWETTTLWQPCPHTSSAPPSMKATVNQWVSSSACDFVGMTVTQNVAGKKQLVVFVFRTRFRLKQMAVVKPVSMII